MTKTGAVLRLFPLLEHLARLGGARMRGAMAPGDLRPRI